MEFKKAVVCWLVSGQEPPALAHEDKVIESLMPLVQTLFPGINYYSMTGFGEAMHICAIPALKKLFPELQSELVCRSVMADEKVEIGSFLSSQGYEWQDSEDWNQRFASLILA